MRGYISTFTQMVVINEKKDNRKYAFLMTLVPDKAYLESTHFAAFSSNYRKWQKGYSGYVFYHTLDGKFNNGWKLENGKVTMSVTQVDEDGVDISMGARRKVTSGTICTTLSIPVWSADCQYAYVNSETYGLLTNYPGTCVNYQFQGNQYLSICYDDGLSAPATTPTTPTSGTGSPNAGYTGPAVKIRTDCASLSTATTSLLEYALTYNGTAYPTSNVATWVSTLRGYASSQSDEYGFSINYENGDYWIYDKNPNGVFCSGSQTLIDIGFMDNAYLQGHTHVNGDLTTPSPRDFITVCNLYLKGATNIHGNVVFAYDGSESMVYVDDQTKFQAFCASIASNMSLRNTGALFPVGSVYANTYDAVYAQLTEVQNYSASIANSYALTYVLDNYNTGIKISYRSDKTTQFKQQYTDDNSYNYYIPYKCP